MFKNYLTHQFAQNFDRSCRTVELEAKTKQLLVKSSGRMLEYFGRSLSTDDPREELRYLFVALQSAKDCREILDDANIHVFEMDARYQVLSGRLEQLCVSAARKAEIQRSPQHQMELRKIG